MAYGQKFLYACLELLNECMFPVKPNGPHHAKRARTTWHVILSNLHLKSSARNGSSNWLLIQGGIFTLSICYFWIFITSIVLLGEWSGQKSLKVENGPFCMRRLKSLWWNMSQTENNNNRAQLGESSPHFF